MKKYILFFILLFATNISISFAESIIELTVNQKTSNINVTQNSTITFNSLSFGNTGSNNVIINFPINGFEYVGYTVDTCNEITGINGLNSSFSYSYEGDGECNIDINYKIITTGNNIEVNSSINNELNPIPVKINSTAKTTLTKAETIDSDSNGFLDKIKLYFSDVISSLSGTFSIYEESSFERSSSGTIYSTGSTEAIINITNSNLFTTGERVRINYSGDTDIDSTLKTSDDKAAPILKEINDLSVNSDIIIQSRNIKFKFSEDLLVNTGAYSIQTNSGTNIAGSFSISNDILTFTATSDLIPGNYKLIGTATDKIAGNSSILDTTFKLVSTTDIEAPIGTKIGTGTGILINNGANQTNSAIVQLDLNAYDNIGVIKMIIGNDNTFSGSIWENYNETKTNYQLSSGTGSKIVYVKFRDAAGNESLVYSDSIIFDDSNHYLIFDSLNTTYTNNSSVTLSGECYNINDTTIKYSIGSSSTGSFQCDNITKKWNNTFTITGNTDNIIKIWYGDNYESATVKNSLTITNPVQKTVIHKETYNTREYSFDSFLLKYLTPQTKTSQNRDISNGYYNLQALFTLDSAGENYTVTNLVETLTCNSGYTKSGSSCIKPTSSSGGGGGGGYYVAPTNNQTTTTTTNTNTTHTNTEISSQGLVDYAKNNGIIIITKETTTTYIEKTYPAYVTISKYFADKTYIENIDLYTSLDNELNNKYKEFLSSYAGIIENLDNYVKTKNITYKQKVNENISTTLKLYESLKTAENKYITRTTGKYKNIYSTNDSKSKAGLAGFEGLVIPKLNKLYESKKISSDTYFKAIDNYNMFILHFSIFKINGNTDSKAKALEFGKSFLQIYYTK